MWYLQFFFYGLAHVRLGSLQFSSWAIHMVMLIFFSNLLGVFMREWKSCNKNAAYAINLALLALLIAVCIIGYGNYLGNLPGER
jgi:L-rhamnose-H+ transport protein